MIVQIALLLLLPFAIYFVIVLIRSFLWQAENLTERGKFMVMIFPPFLAFQEKKTATSVYRKYDIFIIVFLFLLEGLFFLIV